MSDYGRFEHSDAIKNKRVILRDLTNTVYRIYWDVDVKADQNFRKYINPKLVKMDKSSFRYYCDDYIILDVPFNLSKEKDIKHVMNTVYQIRYYFTFIDENAKVVEGYISVYTSKFYYKDKPVVIINYLNNENLNDFIFVRKHLSIEVSNNFIDGSNKHFRRQLNFIDCNFNYFHSSTKTKIKFDWDFAFKNDDYARKTNLTMTFINVNQYVGIGLFNNEFKDIYGLIKNSFVSNAKLSNLFVWLDDLHTCDSEISYIADQDLIWLEDHMPVIKTCLNTNRDIFKSLTIESSKLFINNKFRYDDDDFERDDMISNEECGSIFIVIKEPVCLVNQYVTLELNVMPYTTKTIGKSAVKKISKVGHVKI